LPILVWALGLTATTVYAWEVAAGRLTHGFVAYYAAARAMAAGHLGAWVYDEALFTRYVQDLTGTSVLDIFGPNPPSMSLLLRPLSSLSPAEARTVWLIASLAAWAWASAVLARRVSDRRLGLATGAVALMMFNPAVFANVRNAQAYLVLAAAQIAAALCLLRGRDVSAGVLLGAGLAIKTSGAPLLLAAAGARRWRSVIAAMSAAAAIVLLAAITGGAETWLRYPAYLWEFLRQPRAAVTAYQTTSSLFRRLCVGDPRWNPAPAADCAGVAWTLPTILVGVAVLVTLRAASRAPARLWLAAGACLSLLALPVAEEHQFVLLALPMMLLLEARPDRADDRTFAWAFAAFGMLLVVPLDETAHRFGSGWSVLLAYPRLYAAWLLWGLVIRELTRSRTAGDGLIQRQETRVRATP
jgi:hypothetical protein